MLDALKRCPTNNYVVVEQEGVSASDYLDGRSTPRLTQYMAGQHDHVKSTVSVPDVVGKINVAEITKYLEANCGPVKTVQLDTPPASKALRSLYMAQQGTLAILHILLEHPLSMHRPVLRRQALQVH